MAERITSLGIRTSGTRGVDYDGQAMITLYDYWRSSAAYRTRIALNLKGFAYEQIPLDLRTGAQGTADYRQINPQALIPSLIVDGQVLTQSVAILEWLEEAQPQPPLLPADPYGRAIVRAMGALIGCDIHPLTNLRVMQRLRQEFEAQETDIKAWAVHWFRLGFAALETLVQQHGRGFAYGDAPTFAECYLVPQVYSAARYGVPIADYPGLAAVVERAELLRAFIKAHPSRQVDADPPV